MLRHPGQGGMQYGGMQYGGGQYGGLPQAYPSSTRAKKGGTGGIIFQAVSVCLLLICLGLGFALVSSRHEIRELQASIKGLHEQVVQLHNQNQHTQSVLSSKETELMAAEQRTLQQQEINHKLRLENQQSQHLEEDIKRLEQETNDAKHNAQTLQHLVDAYKQHWSEEVANHNQREQNWVLIQEEWEKLEKQMEQEIISLRQQLKDAKVQAGAPPQEWSKVKPHHLDPDLLQPDVDPLDNPVGRPPVGKLQTATVTAGVGPASPRPAGVPIPSPAPQVAVDAQAMGRRGGGGAPVPAQQQQGGQQQQHGQPVHQGQPPAAPVPVPSPQNAPQQQQQQQPVPTPQQQQPVPTPRQQQPVPTPQPQQQQPVPTPQQQHQQQRQAVPQTQPQPQQQHQQQATPQHQQHQQQQQATPQHQQQQHQGGHAPIPEPIHTDQHEQDQYFNAHNFYADYPGFVDEHAGHDQHVPEEHHGGSWTWHHDDHAHDAGGHQQHHRQQQEQQHAGHPPPPDHQQQQQHSQDWHDPPAQHHPPEGHHGGHVHDDLSWKLGMGGHAQ